jgi:hypothetical protein
MGVATFVAEDQLRNRSCMQSVIIDSFGMTVAGQMQNGNGLVRGVIDLDLRPIISKAWDSTTYVDYAQYLHTHRRPELYGALTAPKTKTIGDKP